MNNTKRHFWAVTCMALVLWVSDQLSTLYFSPNLMHEGNPIHSKLGLGWPGLLIGTLSMLLLGIGMFYYHLFVFNKYFHYQGSASNLLSFIKSYFSNTAIKKNYSKMSVSFFKKPFWASLLNIAGYCCIWHYLIYTIYAIADNLLAGVVYRNSTISINIENGQSKDITLSLNKSPVWNTTIGDLAIWHYKVWFRHEKEIEFILSSVILLSLFLIFFIKKFKKYTIKSEFL